MLLEERVCYDQCVLLTKLCSPLLCFTLYYKVNLACYSRYLLTSYFCIPIPYDEKDIFLVLFLKSAAGLHRTKSTSASSTLVVGAYTWITVILNGYPLKRTKIILSFLRLHPSTAFQTLMLTVMATSSLLRDSCLQ